MMAVLTGMMMLVMVKTMTNVEVEDDGHDLMMIKIPYTHEDAAI